MGRKSEPGKDKEDDGSGRLGRLDEHTMGYYRRVSEKIQEGFENDEEKAMFMGNVYSELEDNEIRLSQNQTVSRILETLLPVSSKDQLTNFLRGFTSDLPTAATDRFASHVLQSTMAAALGHVGKTADSDLAKIYVSVSEQMSENIQDVMMDTYASHVLRSLIACLAGIQVAENVSRSKLSRGQQHRALVSETKIVLSSPPGAFAECLESLSQAITGSESLNTYLTSPTASPVLEVLLLSLHQRDQDQCHQLTRKILKQAKLLSKDKGDQEEDSALPQMVIHPVSSHLLEVILKVISDELLSKVIGRSFRGRLLKVAMHRVANFILQRLLERTKDLPVFEELFDELIVQIESILAVNHLGVIQRLAAGCVSHTSKQVPFLQGLMKAFHCYEPKDRQTSCVPLCASMVTYDVMFGTKEEGEEASDNPTPPGIQLQGSLLLQEMLKFTKNGTLLNSFLAMPPKTLVAMATDPCGSHLLEAFMKSTIIGEKKKDQFVENLKGSYFQIACSKHGSRTIEGIFRSASIKSKFTMAECLEEREAHLLSHHFGRFVHRNLSLGHFKTRRQDWKSTQMRQLQKRKMFADIVGGAPTKKEKTADTEKHEDKLAKELAQLTGAGELAQADEQELGGEGENDEITAIFSSLPGKKDPSSGLSPPTAHSTDKGKKKKRKKKKVSSD